MSSKTDGNIAAVLDKITTIRVANDLPDIFQITFKSMAIVPNWHPQG